MEDVKVDEKKIKENNIEKVEIEKSVAEKLESEKDDLNEKKDNSRTAILDYCILVVFGIVISNFRNRTCLEFSDVYCFYDSSFYQFLNDFFFGNELVTLVYFVALVCYFCFSFSEILKKKSVFKALKLISLIFSGVAVIFSFSISSASSEPCDDFIAKPVLYLYPEEKELITVNFEHEDRLLTTYPKFKDEWEVVAEPNGDLTSDSKYYYGLFWDEENYKDYDFSTGFYVSGEEAISFLEEKLNYIGLNDRERNEFIMYWLPILEQNEHNLVHFDLTEEREKENKIYINPKPDSLLRVSIVIKKVDGKTNIKEQELEMFERVGFSAVEWGGIVVD